MALAHCAQLEVYRLFAVKLEAAVALSEHDDSGDDSAEAGDGAQP